MNQIQIDQMNFMLKYMVKIHNFNEKKTNAYFKAHFGLVQSEFLLIRDVFSKFMLLEEWVDYAYINRTQPRGVFEFYKKLGDKKLNYDPNGDVIPDYILRQRFNCILFFYLYDRVLFMEAIKILYFTKR
jgi:hypothetical protein